jgi:hypothetical protein
MIARLGTHRRRPHANGRRARHASSRGVGRDDVPELRQRPRQRWLVPDRAPTRAGVGEENLRSFGVASTQRERAETAGATGRVVAVRAGLGGREARRERPFRGFVIADGGERVAEVIGGCRRFQWAPMSSVMAMLARSVSTAVDPRPSMSSSFPSSRIAYAIPSRSPNGSFKVSDSSINKRAVS